MERHSTGTSEVSQEAAVSAENDVTVNSGDIKSAVLANAVQQAQANGVVTKAMVNSVLKSSDALEELGVVRAGQSDVKIRKEIKEKLTNLAGDLLESAALDKRTPTAALQVRTRRSSITCTVKVGRIRSNLPGNMRKGRRLNTVCLFLISRSRCRTGSPHHKVLPTGTGRRFPTAPRAPRNTPLR